MNLLFSTWNVRVAVCFDAGSHLLFAGGTGTRVLEDVTLQIPDVSKFQAATGWRPVIPTEQTLGDLLDYHRDRLKSEGPR